MKKVAEESCCDIIPGNIPALTQRIGEQHDYFSQYNRCLEEN
jgi:hypothetical protein